MIDVRVLAMKPHPDFATNNPGWWAVQYRVSYRGTARTFWRWYNKRNSKDKPSADEVVEHFWDDTFGNLHGFDFGRDVEYAP
jgi:hypothetical protein